MNDNNCHKSMRWLSRKDLTTKPDDLSLNPGITCWKERKLCCAHGDTCTQMRPYAHITLNALLKEWCVNSTFCILILLILTKGEEFWPNSYLLNKCSTTVNHTERAVTQAFICTTETKTTISWVKWILKLNCHDKARSGHR